MLDSREVGCTLTTEDYVNGVQASCAGCPAAISIRLARAIESTADDSRRMHDYASRLRFVRTGTLGSQARGLLQSKKVRRFVRDFDNDRKHDLATSRSQCSSAPRGQAGCCPGLDRTVGQLLPSLSACLAALAVVLFALPSCGS